MISYVTLGSNDRVKAKAFYDRVLAPLGLTPGYADDEMVGYGPSGGEVQLWIVQPYNGLDASVGNGVMLGLAASTRAQVDAVHAAALAHGGRDEGQPGPREIYGPNVYVAYFRDLDGNKLSVTCKAPA
ncbi:VOC family protein [Roseateles amylovorans]|uniref:VOC family protein n=1 Tax=Roseateles amylovorans TaxID=2978473 RepID=A0ABY6B3G6_9BURK|nr:VOC family protein [Roseateles amylovorans]UXH79720.1 VOC family protein [Roseateles amylovorans]